MISLTHIAALALTKLYPNLKNPPMCGAISLLYQKVTNLIMLQRREESPW